MAGRTLTGPFSWFDLLGEFGHDFDGQDDVGGGATAGEVGNGKIEALEDGAGDMEAGDVLEGFVEDVTGVEVGDDEDVGMAGNGRIGEFLLSNFWIYGGVELHFAIQENL